VLVEVGSVRALRNAVEVGEEVDLRAWLLRILTNLNIDRGRREQRAPDMKSIDEDEFALFRKLDDGSAEEDVDRFLDNLETFGRALRA